MTPTTLHLVTFRRGSLVLGVDVRNVRRVLRAPRIRPLPASPAFVSGGITVGERLEVLVDLGVLLAKHGEPPESPGVLLVRSRSRDFGLLADDLGEVIEVLAEAMQAAPPFLGGEHARLLRGIVPRKADEVLVLDLDTLAATEVLRSAETAVPSAAESVPEAEDRPRS